MIRNLQETGQQVPSALRQTLPKVLSSRDDRIPSSTALYRFDDPLKYSAVWANNNIIPMIAHARFRMDRLQAKGDELFKLERNRMRALRHRIWEQRETTFVGESLS